MNWKYKSKDGKEILVRKAVESDLQDICNIWNDMVDEKDYTMGRDKFTLEQEKEYFKSLSDRECFLVAILDDKIVGYSHLNTHYKQSMSTSHVAYVGTWIVKEQRENGIGSALISATLELVKELDYEKATTLVRASNKRALAFYKKAGFYEVGTYKKHIKIDDEYDDWVIIEKMFESGKIQ